MKNLNKISSENFEGTTTTSFDPNNNDKIALLVISCNRANAVDNHLRQLISQIPKGEDKFRIVVSQDCNNQPTSQAILKYSKNIYSYIKVDLK